MKVQFSQSIDVESEIDITAQDVAKAVQELFAEAGYAIEFDATEGGRRFSVRQFLNASLACLTAVSDEMIAALTPQQRDRMAAELRALGERFHPRREAGE
jgi:hypothetical protein